MKQELSWKVVYEVEKPDETPSYRVTCTPKTGPESDMILAQLEEEQVMTSGGEPSLPALREAGLADSALRRIIVIDFGADESAFDAVLPEGYFVEGRWIRQREFDQRFT